MSQPHAVAGDELTVHGQVPWDHGNAMDFANELVAEFSECHPGVVMNLNQWLDLKEMIQRRLRGLPWTSEVVRPQ